MGYLLLIKRGDFENYLFSESQLKILNQISDLSLSEAFLKTRIRTQYGHSCLAVKAKISLIRDEVLDYRKKMSAGQIDLIYLEEYVDSNIQSLFFFDMDSTVIKEEVIDELARKHGVYDEVAKVTKQAMEGSIAFDEALRKRVKYLKGLSRQSFKEVYELLNLNAGMDILLRELPTKKTLISILSGGFTPVLNLFAEKYPIDFFKANRLEENDSVLTGEILGEIINKENKAKYLESYRIEKIVSKHQTVAVGDGVNDALMLQTAGLGIGFHAKQGLKDQILNWIDFTDLSVLLFLFRPAT